MAFIVMILGILNLFLPFILRINLMNAYGVWYLYYFFGAFIPCVLYFMGSLKTSFDFILDLDSYYYGFICIFIAFTISTFFCLPFRKKRIHKEKIKITTLGLDIISIASIFFFLIYFSVSIWAYGGFLNFIESSYSRVRTNNSIVNFVSIFMWGSVVFSIISYYAMKEISLSKRLKFQIYIAILCGLIISLMAGGRAVLAFYLFALLTKYILTQKKYKVFLIGIATLLVFFIASYFIIYYRFYVQSQGNIAIDDLDSTEALNGLVFVDHIMLSIKYASIKGFDYGAVYLNSFISFLPRGIFEDKATALAFQMRGFAFGDETAGVPPGLFGEAYIAIGILGVILISIIYGRFLYVTTVIYNNAIENNCNIRFAILGIIIPLFGFLLVRIGIDLGFLRIGMPLFFCWLGSKIISLKYR